MERGAVRLPTLLCFRSSLRVSPRPPASLPCAGLSTVPSVRCQRHSVREGGEQSRGREGARQGRRSSSLQAGLSERRLSRRADVVTYPLRLHACPALCCAAQSHVPPTSRTQSRCKRRRWRVLRQRAAATVARRSAVDPSRLRQAAVVGLWRREGGGVRSCARTIPEWKLPCARSKHKRQRIPRSWSSAAESRRLVVVGQSFNAHAFPLGWCDLATIARGV